MTISKSLTEKYSEETRKIKMDEPLLEFAITALSKYYEAVHEYETADAADFLATALKETLQEIAKHDSKVLERLNEVFNWEV